MLNEREIFYGAISRLHDDENDEGEKRKTEMFRKSCAIFINVKEEIGTGLMWYREVYLKINECEMFH